MTNRVSVTRIDSRTKMGVFGMRLFLVSLSVLFAASMIGYLVVRLRAPEWPPPGTPLLPGGLWASTAVLLLSSATMAVALRGARSDHSIQLQTGVLLTTVLGLLFLLLQFFNWRSLSAAQVSASGNLYGFTFYMLTGLHAAHVIGGVAALFVVTVRAFAGRYGSSHHAGLLYCSMYWHFLDIVWLLLFTVLFLGQRG